MPGIGKPGFTLLPASKTGIEFSNSLQKEQIAGNRFLLGGSGVAAGDVDGDGLVDLYFCKLDGPNALYKNLGGWEFEDMTEKAGVACPDRFSTGTTFADLDGDGDLDLLVNALGGPNACFFNDGSGVFTEVTESAGLQSNKGGTSMALADIDGDGDLDIYVTNFKERSVESIFPPAERAPHLVAQKIGDSYQISPKFEGHYRIETVDGQPVLFENPDTDFLFLNDGAGHFTQVLSEEGRFLDETGNPMPTPKDWGLQPTFRDMDKDGDPDIYVCNDYWSPDRIWLNDGAGRFRAIAANAIRHTSRFTMAVDFADIDRDGNEDFLLIDMLSRNHEQRLRQMSPPGKTPNSGGRPQVKRNTLFLNRGDHTFVEIGQFSGVEASEWTWTARFLDVDLDGWEDILTTNGQLHDFEDVDTNTRVQQLSAFGYDYRRLTPLYPDYLTPNAAFRNKGDLTFEDASETWGFTEPDIAWGMAFADFDNDGDLDLATNRLDKPAGIYRNESAAPRIAVRLIGQAPNTQSVGAKVRVLDGPGIQQKEVICGGTYLSGSDPLLVFAAGDLENRLTIEVRWRNGKISRIENVAPNHLYEIFESHARSSDSSSTPAAPSPWFEDVSDLLDHKHNADDFDDFQRQPLLPKRVSRSGPGAAWLDFDGDKDDDLIVGGGKNGGITLFRNDGGSGFSRIKNSAFTEVSERNQTAVLGLKRKNGMFSILAASSRDLISEGGAALLTQHDFKGGDLIHSSKIDLGSTTPGPMALADYDGDGDLDLFLGGRAIPGRYPEPSPSLFFKNEGGHFVGDASNSESIKSAGLVSGAVFSDLDGDGDSDLILAIEWGAPAIFRNENGAFRDATSEWRLEPFKGLWQGVATGDFDEDGKPDIVATNWGLNTAYPASIEQPRHLYYGDFDSNGIFDIIEAHYDSALKKVLPDRGFSELSRAMPIVRSRMQNNKKYAAAGVEEILGSTFERARVLTANTLENMVFLNRGNRFEAVVLPVEAQLTAAFHSGVADFDGDGHDDIFLSQNFFSTRSEDRRQDGGRGLWLRGDGRGKFEAVPGHISGIQVYGEQRAAALSDFDQDGRIDLVVTQNNDSTKLYRNVLAKPGLRIKLLGPADNPDAVGAMVRVVYRDGSFGPSGEVQAGTGYLSQNSVVQVLGLRANPAKISVRWPDGKSSEFKIDGKSRLIVIDYKNSIAGKIEM